MTRFERAKNAMFSLFNEVRYTHCTQEQYLNRRQDVFYREDWTRLTTREKAYILAKLEGMSEALYWHDLVWSHLVGGRWVSAEAFGSMPGADYSKLDGKSSAYVWRATLDSQTQKRY